MPISSPHQFVIIIIKSLLFPQVIFITFIFINNGKQHRQSISCLVTGATGFVASHVVKLLLEKDFKVRGSVRSLANKSKYQFLYDLVPSKNHNLTLVEAELTDKASWPGAVEGCQYVFHVASPIPAEAPKDENELIVPAVEGTLNVLEASLAKGVKKVVVTSSCIAIVIGNAKVCTEDDWSNEAYCQGYPKSKVLAEKAVWKFYEEHKNKIQVSVVNPGAVFGPQFTKQGGICETIVSDILSGDFPGVFDVTLGIVDVRDLAECHYRAMFNENFNGQRVICSGEDPTIKDMVGYLKKEFGKYGYDIQDQPVTVEDVNNGRSKMAKTLAPLIGIRMDVDNKKSKQDLGLTYLPVEKTLIDMAYSLIKIGVVVDKANLSKII